MTFPVLLPAVLTPNSSPLQAATGCIPVLFPEDCLCGQVGTLLASATVRLRRPLFQWLMTCSAPVALQLKANRRWNLLARICFHPAYKAQTFAGDVRSKLRYSRYMPCTWPLTETSNLVTCRFVPHTTQAIVHMVLSFTNSSRPPRQAVPWLHRVFPPQMQYLRLWPASTLLQGGQVMGPQCQVSLLPFSHASTQEYSVWNGSSGS